MKEENIKILDDLNKGCCMGSDAVNVILEKVEEKSLKNHLEKLLEKYEDLIEKINKTYEKYSDNEPSETTSMNKAMTWYGIQIRTITDSSSSKLSELILQGLNMGIIEGRKMLNKKHSDKKINSLIKEFVDMQEEYVEILKEYL